MRKVLSWMLALGCVASSFGTEARLLSMGRNDAFFMDEMSVFRNPANISIYPNMVLGGLGTYDTSNINKQESTTDLKALERKNRDPYNPFFGAFISYSLNQSSDGGSQFPMLSLGAVFNRYDPLLDYIKNGTSVFNGPSNIKLVNPIGKVDVILGYALQNGGMVGAGGYVAFQDTNIDGSDRFKSNIYKGNAGINWPIAKSMDLEVALGGGVITAIGDTGTTEYKHYVLADNDINFNGDIRLFSALTSLNGDFVPHLGIQYLTLRGGDYTKFNLAGGIGLNINIDKGFFWAGLEGLYEQKNIDTDTSMSGIGGRVSFGIERNVVWDWFVVRVGGSKKIMYVNENANKTYWQQNPEGDMSNDDMIGFGLGLNVENRLKFDVVVAEDVPFTFTNLFSGPMDHILTRIDATYSF